jgi:hypothetical protein
MYEMGGFELQTDSVVFFVVFILLFDEQLIIRLELSCCTCSLMIKGERRKRSMRQEGEISCPSIVQASLNRIDEISPHSEGRVLTTRRSKRLRLVVATNAFESERLNRIKPQESDVIVTTSASSLVIQKSSELMDRILQRNRIKYSCSPRYSTRAYDSLSMVFTGSYRMSSDFELLQNTVHGG